MMGHVIIVRTTIVRTMKYLTTEVQVTMVDGNQAIKIVYNNELINYNCLCVFHDIIGNRLAVIASLFPIIKHLSLFTSTTSRKDREYNTLISSHGRSTHISKSQDQMNCACLFYVRNYHIMHIFLIWCMSAK